MYMKHVKHKKTHEKTTFDFIITSQVVNQIEIMRSASKLLLLLLQREMKKVNKQCLLDTPCTVRVSEKTWQVIVQTRRP